MKVIELVEHAVAEDKKFYATEYPGVGAYVLGNGAIALVYPLPGAAMLRVFIIDDGRPFIKEELQAIHSQTNQINSGLSEEFVLKALAIAQHPELAASLVK